MGLDIAFYRRKIVSGINNEPTEELCSWYGYIFAPVHLYFVINRRTTDNREYVISKMLLERLLDKCKKIEELKKDIKYETKNVVISYYWDEEEGQRVYIKEPRKVVKNTKMIQRTFPPCLTQISYDGVYTIEEDYFVMVEMVKREVESILNTTNFNEEEIIYIASY